MESTATEKIRHSAAHIVAQAVQRLYPNVKLGIGPATTTGFYYDIFSDDHSLEEINIDAFFTEIETEVADIIGEELSFTQVFITKDEALNLLYRQGQIFKTEILQSIDQDKVSFYKTGSDFIDLCRGPHVQHTGKVGGIKLLKISEQNWLNDSSRPLMLRIEGLAFETKQQLTDYIELRNQIKSNNHLKIGKRLGLITEIEFEKNNLINLTSQGNIILKSLDKQLVEMGQKLDLQLIELPQIFPKNIQHMNITDINMDYGFINGSNAIFTKLVKILNSTTENIQAWQTHVRTEATSNPDLTNYFHTRVLHAYSKHPNRDLTQITRNYIQTIVSTYYKWLNTKLKLYVAIPKDVLSWFSLEEIVSNQGLEVSKQLLDVESKTIEIKFRYEDPLNNSWELSSLSIKKENMDTFTINSSLVSDIFRLFGLILEKTQGSLPLSLIPDQVVVVYNSDDVKHYASTVMQTLRGKNLRAKLCSNENKQNLKTELVGFFLNITENEKKNSVVSLQLNNGENQGLMSIQEFLQKYIDVV